MIHEVSRGHIKVEIRGRTVTVPGEMFFPPNDKLGFAISKSQIKFWDPPYHAEALSSSDVDEVIDDIRQDFAKGGHVLEVE